MLTLCLAILLATIATTSLAENSTGLLGCLKTEGVRNVAVQHTASYDPLLKFSLQNLRFTEPRVKKPYAILLPGTAREVQSAVKCAVENDWRVLARSGGHSYEGLSSTSEEPFVIVDLMRLDSVYVDVAAKTATVEGGATIGQLYTAIANASKSLAFAAGTCPTMGTGGHFSGGGFSTISRKYGLAADNIINAVVVDGTGRLLSGEELGKDVLWALRGGGGGSFVIVVRWQLRLVDIPSKVTAFKIKRFGAQNVLPLFQKWQEISPKFSEDLYMRALLTTPTNNSKDVLVNFNGLFLGNSIHFHNKLSVEFPELSVKANETAEVDWINSVAYIDGSDVTQLANRSYGGKSYWKMKSDFLTKPIPEDGVLGLFEQLAKRLGAPVVFSPMGGAEGKIPSDQIAFPHRKGYTHFIQYIVSWKEEMLGEQDYNIEWMRRLHDYMTPYVSSNPRAAYVNYLDLDLGTNDFGKDGVVEHARKTFGRSYFGDNFDRLVKAKTVIDPLNVFRHSQSIPVSGS